LPPLDDPDLIGVWWEDDTPLLFFHRPKEGLVQRLCRRLGVRVTYQADLAYEDWEAGGAVTGFTTRRCAVRPVWEAADEPLPPGRDAVEIVLDPSVVFGTGFHPSTRMCLEMIEDLLESREIRTMADLGTGTGLLAICAARLAGIRALALDNNPLACDVARANAAANGVEHLVEVRQADLRTHALTQGYDLVVANLYKGLLESLVQRDWLWRSRIVLLSGFVPHMEADLLAALPSRRLRLLERRSLDIWRAWLLETRDDVA